MCHTAVQLTQNAGQFQANLYFSLSNHAVGNTNQYCQLCIQFFTIFHKLQCMCWGQLSLFHTGRSLLNLYKIVFMRDLLYILIPIKSTNMFSNAFANWSAQVVILKQILPFKYKNLMFLYMGIWNMPSKSNGSMQNLFLFVVSYVPYPTNSPTATELGLFSSLPS